MSGRILKPGRYGLAFLQVGDMIETGTRTITPAMIDEFAALTGDRFDIHMDKAAAQRHGFVDRVAHGLLVLSVVDGLKNQAPAQFDAVASLGWDWRFAAPVLVNDTIGVCISVRDRRKTSNPERGIVTLDFDVTNQDGQTVQQGRNQLMVYA